MKLVLNKQQQKNIKLLNDAYNSPEGKEGRLKAYEWGEKVLDS